MSLDVIERVLADPQRRIVGHNTAYEFATLGASYPKLLPAIFDAYRSYRITCTQLRQQLIVIATQHVVGDDDAVRAYGLARLQRGEIEEAARVLFESAQPGTDGRLNANAAATAALAAAALGDHSEVMRLVAALDGQPTTYLDRFRLMLAEGLSAARQGDGARAREIFGRASEAIDNTGDKLAAALAALAEAISLDALGDALAPSAHELAEQMLDDLGIDADGWRTAFRAAAGSL